MLILRMQMPDIYLQALKRRKALNDECDFLKRQNIEIAHLLHQYSTK